MKKLKVFVTTLCLIATLAFAIPTTAYADAGGPQGNKNSAPQPPPPPPPPKIDWVALLWALANL
jgi:hypothetical protein